MESLGPASKRPKPCVRRAKMTAATEPIKKHTCPYTGTVMHGECEWLLAHRDHWIVSMGLRIKCNPIRRIEGMKDSGHNLFSF